MMSDDGGWKKNAGKKTEPWGTPQVGEAGLQDNLPTV